MRKAALKETPLELTKGLRDVSVTERGAFRSCRRRWSLETIENLTSKDPSWPLIFGTGVHAALETLYADRLKSGKVRPSALKKAHQALHDWQKEEEKKLKKELGSFATSEVIDELRAYRDLGCEMLTNYIAYDNFKGDGWKVKAVEGIGIDKLSKKSPQGYGKDADVLLHESGRFMVPIVNPDDKTLIESPSGGPAFLTARIDLLVERPKPRSGLWVVDHKTAAQAPNDRGIDFDDQITGYCYVVWRLTGIVPRGVVFNVLVKQVPKEPRYVEEGSKLSTAKDQLTLPHLYKAELKKCGLIDKKGRIDSEKHAACYAALLERGWDPFFRRFEVKRNLHELESFERRLFEEYGDMAEAWENEAKQYPNPSTWHCPGCSVAPICQAMEDGSDFQDIIEHRFIEADDRKAA